MQSLEVKKPYDKFLQACDNEETRKEYAAVLRRFMQYYEIAEYEELLKIPTEQLEDLIIDYILDMKKKLSQGYVTLQVAGVRKFLSCNRINLNWDFINQHKKGDFKRKTRVEAYTHEQIAQLLQVCDIRTRAIVLLFSSTGMRIGALPELKLKLLKKVNDLYQLTIYEGYEEEYTTFCTPEAVAAVDNYLAFRKRQGEKLTPESYLIRQQFDINDLDQIRKESRAVSASTIRNVIWNCLIKSGLRVVNHNAGKAYRTSIAGNHGFRKFFTTQLVNSNLNVEKRWLLEGHNLKGNDSSYVKVSAEQLYEEYSKAVDLLTINPENRLRRKVEKLEVEKNQFERLAGKIAEIEAKLNR